jgi:hypothetical protein
MLKYLIALVLTIHSCGDAVAKKSNASFQIEPKSSDERVKKDAPAQKISNGSTKLSVIVPVMDPNLPKDSNDYQKLGVWPELRYAEANRFARQLKVSLDKTGAFAGVGVFPDASAAASLYVLGKILKSNGEDVNLEIVVIDISGKQRIKKVFKNRIKEYDVANPRNKGKDLYISSFDSMAKAIAKSLKKIQQKDLAKLDMLETLRFGESMSANYFSKFLKTSRAGKVSVAYAPAQSDPMLLNLEVVRIKDQLFSDQLQADYARFSAKMDESYSVWQEQAFAISKQRRIAKAAANKKALLGGMAIIAGAVVGATGSSGSVSGAAGTPLFMADAAGTPLFMVGAAVAIFDSCEDQSQAKKHKNVLNELGSQLNLEMATKNIKLENELVNLQGTAAEQAATWRAVLREYYLETATPNVDL